MNKFKEKFKTLIECVEIEQLSGVEPPVLSIVKLCYKAFEGSKLETFNHSSDSVSNLPFLIQSCLDRMHERVNMGNWKDVSLSDRQCITVLSFFKVLVYLEYNDCTSEKIILKAFEIIDNGLLFGAPLSNMPEDLLHRSANLLTSWKTANNSSGNVTDNSTNAKRNDLAIIQSNHSLASISCASEADWENMTNLPSSSEDNENFNKYGIALGRIPCPSLEAFDSQYFKMKTPAVLTKCMMHWPAMKLWPDTDYILNKAGHRTVPIEIGSSYTDGDWTQKLMTVKEFINEQIFNSHPKIGYLAQHQLFNQIPELLQDIKVPDYCCLREDDSAAEESVNLDVDPDINAWFGPCGTISPLHYDPKHNLLAQVIGEKLIILFSPEDTPYLYCHPDNLLHNTARVDPTQPDLINYPELKNATPYYCILKPGDMLYIPPKWWHYVKSLAVSFSVSFWWR